MEELENKEITIDTLLLEQNNDPIISELRNWITNKEIPPYKYTEMNNDLKHFKQRFPNLIILDNQLIAIEQFDPDPPHTKTNKIILPLTLLLAVFKNAHVHPLHCYIEIFIL